MDNSSTNKKMSYLDKIKKNKGKVQTRKKKVKQNAEIKKKSANKPPSINIVQLDPPKKPEEEEVAMVTINGSGPGKEEKPKESGQRFSIKISAPKQHEGILEMSEKSSQSNRISEKKEGLFGGKKDAKDLDSNFNLSDNSGSQYSGKGKKVKHKIKKTHFGHQRKESKSQRNNLKLELKETSGSKSQRGLKTSSTIIA